MYYSLSRINRHLCEKSSCSTYPEKTLDLQRDYLKHDRRKRQERLNLLWSLLQSRLSINNQIIHDCSKVAWSQILVRINHSLSRSSSKNFSSPEIITAKNLQRKLVKIRKNKTALSCFIFRTFLLMIRSDSEKVAEMNKIETGKIRVQFVSSK